MPRMRRKGDLPTKDCRVCGRPFAWRRKWAACWEAVALCSEACRRRDARRTRAAPPRPDGTASATSRQR